MSGQVWLQIAGFFAVAVPALMILTHLIDHLGQGFTAPATEIPKTRTYTDFAQIRKELLAGVSIEEILERCNGSLPEETQGVTNIDDPTADPTVAGRYSVPQIRARLEEVRRRMYHPPLPPDVRDWIFKKPPIRF